jgi:enamine deaminase RidA (YjgF/YER057c/UK114 family)
MAHKRIRPFNTKQTYPEQKLDNDLAQAVVARGTMVFLRGQVSQDLDSRESLHVGDAAQQTEKAMRNIKMLLEESGSCLDDVCRIVVYLTDIRYREDVYQGNGQMAEGRASMLDRPCGSGAGATRMGCRDRR